MGKQRNARKPTHRGYLADSLFSALHHRSPILGMNLDDSHAATLSRSKVAAMAIIQRGVFRSQVEPLDLDPGIVRFYTDLNDMETNYVIYNVI